MQVEHEQGSGDVLKTLSGNEGLTERPKMGLGSFGMAGSTELWLWGAR
jgi:hypothetical protein